MLSRMAGTIVVGYDDKEPAARALDRAIEEARTSNGRLVVVAVLEMPLDPTVPPNFGTPGDRPPLSADRGLPAELEPALASARERLEATQVPAKLVWAVGDPARVIVDAAKDHGADLIVLGSHHHSFLGRMFGEDIAAAVKHDAGCDVLVVE
jgi:nucleotide-binding universal stress UspA family protein